MTLLVSLLIGIVAGSRAMLAPAAVAWAAWLGWIDLALTWASFLGSGWTVLILSVLALGEFVTDQLPTTPSRKVPVQFGSARDAILRGRGPSASLRCVIYGHGFRAGSLPTIGGPTSMPISEDSGRAGS